MARAKFFKLTIFVSLVAVLALFFVTSPVLADSEAPPGETDTEVTPLPTDSSEVVVEETLEMTVGDTTTPVEESTPAPTTEEGGEGTIETTAEPTLEITAPAETGDDITAQQELVEALSENEMVLTDEGSNVISMATEAGSEAAETSDPYFMAGGVYYGFSSTGICSAVVLPANCTTTANPISAAINAYQTTYAGTATGAIYLEAGTYNESASLIVSTASTLTGIIGAGSDTTTINMSAGTNLSISDTIKGFTLQGVTINGNIDSTGGSSLVDFNNNTGALTIQDVVVKNDNANGDGIEVTGQTGNVTLNKVQSTANQDDGAKITTTGNVVINNSEFDLNYGPVGLAVTATGTITMNGVSASENYGTGADLYSQKGITINNSLFERNHATYGLGNGISIYNATGSIIMNTVLASNNEGSNIYLEDINGAVTLSNIEANSAGDYGIYIDNCKESGGICTSSIAGNVTMNNVQVQYTDLANVYVSSSGAIFVSGLTSYDSYSSNGAVLSNESAKSAKNVTVINGTFTSSEWSGLLIRSKGSVSLNHVEANYNNFGTGIDIDVTYGTGTVTILNTLGDNIVNYNIDGLVINAKGNVTINQIQSEYNDQSGISINNYQGTGNVTLKNAYVYGNSSVSGDNIYIFSHGAVTLTGIDSWYSDHNGIWINNDGASSAKTVTLTDVDAWYNDADGLVVFSRGSIVLKDVESYGNNNNPGISTYGGIYLDNSIGTSGVTITNSTSNSSISGWYILTKGVVLINGVEGNYNDTFGMVVNNTSSISTPAVTIKFGEFDGNGVVGLDVDSKGVITLTSVDVSSNNTTANPTGYGVDLNNTYGTAGVTLTGSATAWNYFGGNNGSDGITIHTNGTVNANYIQAYYNDKMGIRVIDTGSGAVTISNVQSLNNDDVGILVIANGNITINNPIVSYNLVDPGTSYNTGIYLDNTGGTGSITVQRMGSVCAEYYDVCTLYSNANYDDPMNPFGTGLVVNSKGTVTLKYLYVSESPDGGILIDNTSGTGSVALTGVDVEYNDDTGIFVFTSGAVTAAGLTGSHNKGWGAYIDNSTGIAKNVSITKGTFIYDDNDGIYLVSNGAVLLAGINASHNAGYGMNVNNSSGIGSITLTYSGSTTNTVNDNDGYGIYFITNGSIVINKTRSSDNQYSGIYLDNPLSTGSVTMNTIETSYNVTGYGVFIRIMGNVSVTGLNVHGDHSDEIYVNNTSGTGNVTVTNADISNSSTGTGLSVYSHGAITLTNVSSSYNYSGWGAYLDNSGSTGTPGVTVQNSGTLLNEFISNVYDLEIHSKGSIKLVNIEAYQSTQTSINVDNTYGTGTVTLTNVTGYSYDATGIAVKTYGAVTGSKLYGSGDDTAYAIFIDNCQLSGICTGSGNVTLNTVEASNSGTGLQINSNGNIVVSNLTVSYNYNTNPGGYGYGAYLDNHHSTGTPYISVLKASVINNEDTGLYIVSKGNVTLDGIYADYNNSSYTSGGNGVFVDNTSGTGNVVVSASKGANSFLETCAGDGLNIVTNGSISLTKVTANNNSKNGITLYTGGVDKAITLNSVTANHNSYYGVYAEATYASTFTKVTAYDNGYSSNSDGVYIDTNGHNFTITGSYLSGNGNNGLEAHVGALQTVKVASTFYFGNGRYGSADAANINTDGKLVFA